jgi:hypothetical protein
MVCSPAWETNGSNRILERSRQWRWRPAVCSIQSMAPGQLGLRLDGTRGRGEEGELREMLTTGRDEVRRPKSRLQRRRRSQRWWLGLLAKAALRWLVRDGKILRGLGSTSRSFRRSQLVQSMLPCAESLDGRRRRFGRRAHQTVALSGEREGNGIRAHAGFSMGLREACLGVPSKDGRRHTGCGGHGLCQPMGSGGPRTGRRGSGPRVRPKRIG